MAGGAFIVMASALEKQRKSSVESIVNDNYDSLDWFYIEGKDILVAPIFYNDMFAIFKSKDFEETKLYVLGYQIDKEDRIYVIERSKDMEVLKIIAKERFERMKDLK